MARLKYRDFEQAVMAARQVHQYCAALSTATALTVTVAKKIPHDLRARIGKPGDPYGFQPVRDWVSTMSAAAVNAYFTGELRDGPANAMKSLGNAMTAARALAVYVHAEVGTLAETHTVPATDGQDMQMVPAAVVAGINSRAAAVLPHVAGFLE